MSSSRLINPDGHLLDEFVARLFVAKKSKPLWAKRVETAQIVDSLEGRQQVKPGDYLCRGIQGECWPQSANKLNEKYVATDDWDGGWQRFDPRPDAAPVQAAQVHEAFRVHASWGELSGKPNDYVVRSSSDLSDIWIVDRTIFEASYSAG